MLADELDYVIGVDTHRDQHTLAVVGAPSGGLVALCSVRASAHGYALPTTATNRTANDLTSHRSICESARFRDTSAGKAEPATTVDPEFAATSKWSVPGSNR